MNRILAIFHLFLFSILLLPAAASGQCSDAGACSIGAMHAEQAEEAPRHQVALRYIYGSSGTPDDLTFHTVQAEGNFELIAGSRIAVRLPFHAAEGPLGSLSGIGDAVLLWDQRIWANANIALHVQAGAKLATGSSDAEGLPQAYQPGLGTSDLLAGLSAAAGPWSAAVAYQYSSERSDNRVDRLRRGDDLMLRGGYRNSIDEFGLGLEVIAIKRLSESSVRDPGQSGLDSFIDLPDSDQFQVNLLGSVSAPVAENLRISLQAAMPLLQRDVNVDGLKRALTAGLGFEWGF